MSRSDRPIFLVGFMGSGKSACGAALGARLGWQCVDTDDTIEARAGRSIERIFATIGEAEFRTLEREALAAIAGRRQVVVATGGGLFLDAAARRLMHRCGTPVWLDVPLVEVRRRVGAGASRPLWPADSLEQRILFERRRAVYALCSIHVAAAPGDPDEMARRVLLRIP